MVIISWALVLFQIISIIFIWRSYFRMKKSDQAFKKLWAPVFRDISGNRIKGYSKEQEDLALTQMAKAVENEPSIPFPFQEDLNDSFRTILSDAPYPIERKKRVTNADRNAIKKDADELRRSR